MVDLSVIIRLVEFILCIFYNGVALIVIPDCIEAIAFYIKIVTATHVGAGGQIQSLKSSCSIGGSSNKYNLVKVLVQNWIRSVV